jgi:serine O-acetyltransferase
MIRDFINDALEMTKTAAGQVTFANIARTVLLDSYPVVAMTRVRETARRWHLPGVNRLIRLVQSTVYGIEIGKDVTLGQGVYFVHTLGTVIGGNAQIGKRVRLMGGNTIGTAKDNGYPIIEDDVVIGCGARILGPVRIGAGAQIGANAVVLTDIPAGAVAVGIPAKPRHQHSQITENEKDSPEAVRAPGIGGQDG